MNSSFSYNVKECPRIFIDIENKWLYLLQDGKCIKEYIIASGKSGLPSPIGYWKIIQKADWGEGFGGRWMGLNVPGECTAYMGRYTVNL